jgi:hypothetical protein
MPPETGEVIVLRLSLSLVYHIISSLLLGKK